MDVIGLVKEGFQSVAEHAASYKMGQTALRHVDRALWVVEKCARWAVPPPLDPEERPQPELVRPLPWVFFLMMLMALRVTREAISLVNLVIGKPPLRSADVVTYIQGKRRYLRTLKYQGNRMMRARTSSVHEPWYSGLRSLFEFTMCFRGQSVHYGNNNTTRVSNNDEVLIVKRSKRVRQNDSPVASSSEASMERLIEKMMVDLEADSNDDSSYTLTNATSVKSDMSDTAQSDHESSPNDVTSPNPKAEPQNEIPIPSEPELRPELKPEPKPEPTSELKPEAEVNDVSPKPEQNDTSSKPIDNDNQTPTKEPVTSTPEKAKTPKTCEEKALRIPDAKRSFPDTQTLLQNERQPQRSPKKEQKIANGRTVKSTSERNIGGDRRERDAVARAASAEFTPRQRKENFKQTP